MKSSCYSLQCSVIPQGGNQMGKLNSDVLTAVHEVVNQIKAEAYEEFAKRLKRCILERDDETIDRIKEKLIKELRK